MNAILIVSPVVVNCHIVPKAAGLIFHSSHSNSLTNFMKCMLHSMGLVQHLSPSFLPHYDTTIPLRQDGISSDSRGERGMKFILHFI